MVFCNMKLKMMIYFLMVVTILILIDGFLQYNICNMLFEYHNLVTILILIDGFLQYMNGAKNENKQVWSQSLF